MCSFRAGLIVFLFMSPTVKPQCPRLVKETENYNSTNVFYPFFITNMEADLYNSNVSKSPCGSMS